MTQAQDVRNRLFASQIFKSGRGFSLDDLRAEIGDRWTRSVLCYVVKDMYDRGIIQKISDDRWVAWSSHPLSKKPIRPNPKFDFEYQGPGPLEWNLCS